MRSSRKSLKVEAALVALLAVNGVYFAAGGSASKAVDSAAWLALLLLFLVETHFAHALNSPLRQLVLRALRLGAAAGVIGAAIGYILEENRLDAINSAVWIGVVVLLEVELRWAAAVARMRAIFTGTAVALYGSLAVLVTIWAVRREWIDAYDALLWLIAYALLELNVIRRQEKPA